MSMTVSTVIGILLVGLGVFSVILIAMNKDQAKIIKSLELQVSQLKQQNGRVIYDNIEHRKAYEKLSENYKGAVAALNVCEVKLNER